MKEFFVIQDAIDLLNVKSREMRKKSSENRCPMTKEEKKKLSNIEFIVSDLRKIQHRMLEI